MPILSVTHIAGTRRSGKSTVAQMFNTKPQHYLIGDCYFPSIKTKADLVKQLNEWKKGETARHVVLVDEKIYDAIDYDFGNIPHYYVSLDHKPAFVAPVEEEQKPILGS